MIFEPIAIVGRACLLPGAESPAALWEAVRAGTDLSSVVPAGRWRTPRHAVVGAPDDAEDSQQEEHDTEHHPSWYGEWERPPFDPPGGNADEDDDDDGDGGDGDGGDGDGDGGTFIPASDAGGTSMCDTFLHDCPSDKSASPTSR